MLLKETGLTQQETYPSPRRLCWWQGGWVLPRSCLFELLRLRTVLASFPATQPPQGCDGLTLWLSTARAPCQSRASGRPGITLFFLLEAGGPTGTLHPCQGGHEEMDMLSQEGLQQLPDSRYDTEQEDDQELSISVVRKKGLLVFGGLWGKVS